MTTSDIFNNYFFAIADKAKLDTSFSHKHFSDFFKNWFNISFLRQNDKTKKYNAMSLVDSNKSVRVSQYFYQNIAVS